MKQIPKERLNALQEFKMQHLCKEYILFREEWTKERRCSCVAELEEGQIINCNHVNKAINDKYKKEKREIWSLAIQKLDIKHTRLGV